MLHLDFIRQHPDLLRAALRKRSVAAPLEETLALAEKRRGLITRCEALRARTKQEDEALREIIRNAPPAERKRLAAPLQAAWNEVRQLEIEIASADSTLHTLLLQFPNLPHVSVPEGTGEGENVEVRRWGAPADFTH
ncbi:MAG TPA: serine--tRNA ligase, partial [Candidatus Angelobacter sp.]|nr:serine--tRNA ligase [Candidatus Angelobacter sp.]